MLVGLRESDNGSAPPPPGSTEAVPLLTVPTVCGVFRTCVSTSGLKPPNSVAKVLVFFFRLFIVFLFCFFPRHTIPTHASQSGHSVWLMTSEPLREAVCEMRAWGGKNVRYATSGFLQIICSPPPPPPLHPEPSDRSRSVCVCACVCERACLRGESASLCLSATAVFLPLR